MKRIIIAFILISLIIAAVFLVRYSRQRSTSGPLRVSGTIEITDAELSFKLPGRVVARLVDEGEPIRTGQVVARLESADLQQEVAARRAEVEAAQAALRELLAGSRKEEIAQAEAALARVAAEEERLRKDLVRQEELYRQEIIASRDIDAARSATDAARAAVREARERLQLVRVGPRPETIDQGRARLKDTEALLALAETRLDYTTLFSPQDGVVLAKNVEPGEQVAAGTPVVTVGDLVHAWVRAYIPETELGKVKLGQEARIFSDTYPGTVYPGRVSFIAPEAEFTPKNVQTQKERVKLVYRIKIDVPNPKQELKPGMPVDAEIGTGDQGPVTSK